MGLQKPTILRKDRKMDNTKYVYPSERGTWNQTWSSDLTMREYFAMHMMQALVAKMHHREVIEEIAESAVVAADALIEQLDEASQESGETVASEE